MRYWDGAVAATACVVLTTVVSVAQEPPVNVELVGNWNGFSTVADVWGTPGVAYVAHFGDAGIHILDISDPTSPTVLAHYRVPANSSDASAQDVKVHNGLMYIGLGSEQSNSAEIVDVRDPANPLHLTWVRIHGELSIHNLFYDNGYLYLVDSGTPKVAIVDLTGYDPNNPPALIDQPLHMLNNVGSSRVHDIMVQDGRLYACVWDSGLWVYDVSNLATQTPSFLGSTPGENTHSCWVTDDNRFVVTGEERSGGGIQVYEIVDRGGSVDLILRDQFTVSTSRAFSVHNQTIVGHRLYNAWYGIGLQVFDIDPATGRLSFVGSYDTNPGTGGGAWGVFPFNGEDEVLISDMSTGLWILDVAPGGLVLGDLNCDDVLNGGDIDPFFLALGDPAAYARQFPNCDALRGDINGDGRLDGGDIDPFFKLLGGG